MYKLCFHKSKVSSTFIYVTLIQHKIADYIIYYITSDE